jgi:large-conductance mechanosensitive channel
MREFKTFLVNTNALALAMGVTTAPRLAPW